MTEPVHIRDLFNKEMLKEDVVDLELILQFEQVYRLLKRFCERNHIDWPKEFEDFSNQMYATYERVERQTDEELIERCKKGHKYVKDNPKNVDARVLLASIEYRLVRRGYNIERILSEKNEFEEIFGDLVYEVGGDSK